MSESSLLETTAEVAVAFAGFIGVFLVLARRDGRFPADDSLTIRVIVAGSVGAVFYSALPLVLHALGVSGASLWRISSATTGLISAAVTAYMIPHLRAIPLAERYPSISLRNLVPWVLAALMFICHLGNVLAWPWAPSGGVYLLAVWSTVAIAGTSFIVLIFRKVL